MGCCQSADSAKKDSVTNSTTGKQTPTQTKNKNSPSKTPKPMTKGSVKNQVHPTVETLVTEETPFDGGKVPKKVEVDFTPHKEVL